MDEQYGPYQKRTARLLAFLGRYMHQPVDVLLALPVDLFSELVAATGALLEKEGPTPKSE